MPSEVEPVITCPACGTENREWASHCGECGKPLPEDARPRPHAADADAPRTERLPEWLRQDAEEQPRPPAPGRRGQAMPPIPDGGLAGTMPPWLGDTNRETRDAPASPPPTRKRTNTPEETPDVTTFLSPEDLPGWLRRLAEIESRADNAPGEPPHAPTVAATGPLIGDESDVEPPATRRDATTESTRDAPIEPGLRASHPLPLPPARRAAPRPDDAVPVSTTSTDRRLTVILLAVAAVAAAMMAYAVYLAVAG